jgi:hypothetical protein
LLQQLQRVRVMISGRFDVARNRRSSRDLCNREPPDFILEEDVQSASRSLSHMSEMVATRRSRWSTSQACGGPQEPPYDEARGVSLLRSADGNAVDGAPRRHSSALGR